MKREPAELIVIDSPVVAVQQEKQALDIADYSGEYEEEEEEDNYDYVDYTAEEERMVVSQGRDKGIIYAAFSRIMALDQVHYRYLMVSF